MKNNWESKNGRLKLSVVLGDFMACVEKVNQIAKIAEEQNHHPDLHITGYKNLEIEIYTHEEDAVTDKDRKLAEAIDEIL